MKKFFSIILIFIFFTLNGCTHSNNINLAVFIDNYNSVSNKDIGFTSFSGRMKNDFTEYSFFIDEEDEKVLVTLVEEGDVITSCRITMTKIDSRLNFDEKNEKLIDLFKRSANEISLAFAGDNIKETESLIDELISDVNVSEKTAEFKNYKMIFISNDLCCEYIIINKWYTENETTNKPENINSFLNTAPIRTETVPHR